MNTIFENLLQENLKEGEGDEEFKEEVELNRKKTYFVKSDKLLQMEEEAKLEEGSKFY